VPFALGAGQRFRGLKGKGPFPSPRRLLEGPSSPRVRTGERAGVCMELLLCIGLLPASGHHAAPD